MGKNVLVKLPLCAPCRYMEKCKYFFLTSALDGMNGQLHAQAVLPLGKEHPLSTG